MNTYAYVGANPIFYIDPLGLAKACTPGTDCPTLPPKNDPAWRPYSGASSVFHCGFSCYHENRKATPENPQGECCYDERDMLVDAKHKYAGCRGTPNQYPSSDPRHLWPDSGGIGKAGLPAFNESRRYDYENRRGNAGGGSTFHGAP